MHGIRQARQHTCDLRILLQNSKQMITPMWHNVRNRHNKELCSKHKLRALLDSLIPSLGTSLFLHTLLSRDTLCVQCPPYFATHPKLSRSQLAIPIKRIITRLNITFYPKLVMRALDKALANSKFNYTPHARTKQLLAVKCSHEQVKNRLVLHSIQQEQGLTLFFSFCRSNSTWRRDTSLDSCCACLFSSSPLQSTIIYTTLKFNVITL